MRSVTIPPERATVILETIKTMTEKQRRQYVAREATAIGYGGVVALSKLTGISIPTIRKGITEIESGDLYERNGRNRKAGGGQKTASEKFRIAVEEKNQKEGTNLETNLNTVVEKILRDYSYGDPCTNNRFTNVTPAKVAEEVNNKYGSILSASSYRRVFADLHYSLQQNAKLEQVGVAHPLRNLQFDYRAEIISQFEREGLPIISCDSKAKVKLGPFASSGCEWRPVHQPRNLEDHDFAKKFIDVYPDGHDELDEYFYDKPAIVAPYGIYCSNINCGYVSLGISADTSEFSANSIINWWNNQGKALFPDAKELLVLVDGGGSNRSKGYLWKNCMAIAASKMGLNAIHVFHHPPGTSKWNFVEHRLFSQISINWKAKPKDNLEVVQGYITHTKTKTGLYVACDIDYNIYLTETKKKQLLVEQNISLLSVESAEVSFNKIAHLEYFHDDPIMRQWNYKIVLN